MERFVRAIVAGGVALVAGLWLLELAVGGTLGLYGGAAVALAGLLAVGAGIWTEVDLAPGE